MASPHSPQAVLSFTQQNFRKLGLAIPGALINELDKIAETEARGSELGADQSGLTAAVFDALYAGKEPTGTKVMQEALLVQLKASNIQGRLREEADRRRAESLRKHTPALIAAMAPVIEEADAALVEARATIPDLDLDPAVAAGLPADHMKAWGRARDAVAQVEMVIKTWALLHPVSRDRTALIVADLTLEQVSKIRHRSEVTDLIATGQRLSLATIKECRDRLDRVAQAQADSDAERVERAEHFARTGRELGAPVPVLANAWTRLPRG